MKNEIKLNGKQTFMGIEIPVIGKYKPTAIPLALDGG